MHSKHQETQDGTWSAVGTVLSIVGSSALVGAVCLGLPLLEVSTRVLSNIFLGTILWVILGTCIAVVAVWFFAVSVFAVFAAARGDSRAESLGLPDSITIRDVEFRGRLAMAAGLWAIAGAFAVPFAHGVSQLRFPQYAFQAGFYYEYDFYALAIATIGAPAIWMSIPRQWWLVVRILAPIAASTGFLFYADSVARHFQPLNAAFQESESDLNRLADDVLANAEDSVITLDAAAGHYHVQSGQVRNGAVILRLDDSDWNVDYNGFIRVSDATVEQIDGEEYGLPESRFRRLSDEWFVFYSWYWSVKDGWS